MAPPRCPDYDPTKYGGTAHSVPRRGFKAGPAVPPPTSLDYGSFYPSSNARVVFRTYMQSQDAFKANENVPAEDIAPLELVCWPIDTHRERCGVVPPAPESLRFARSYEQWEALKVRQQLEERRQAEAERRRLEEQQRKRGGISFKKWRRRHMRAARKERKHRAAEAKIAAEAKAAEAKRLAEAKKRADKTTAEALERESAERLARWARRRDERKHEAEVALEREAKRKANFRAWVAEKRCVETERRLREERLAAAKRASERVDRRQKWSRKGIVLAYSVNQPAFAVRPRRRRRKRRTPQDDEKGDSVRSSPRQPEDENSGPTAAAKKKVGSSATSGILGEISASESAEDAQATKTDVPGRGDQSDSDEYYSDDDEIAEEPDLADGGRTGWSSEEDQPARTSVEAGQSPRREHSGDGGGLTVTSFQPHLPISMDNRIPVERPKADTSAHEDVPASKMTSGATVAEKAADGPAAEGTVVDDTVASLLAEAPRSPELSITERRLEKGSRVRAKLDGWRQHYPGRITAVNSDGTFDLAFDDGDRADNVRAAQLEHLGAATPLASTSTSASSSKGSGQASRFTVDMRVRAKMPDWDKWYSGKVTGISANGSVDIFFDDGDRIDDVPADIVRALDPPSPVPKQEPAPRLIAVRDRIEAKLPIWDRYYPGVVSVVNANGTFDITFDDGDTASDVAADCVRML